MLLVVMWMDHYPSTWRKRLGPIHWTTSTLVKLKPEITAADLKSFFFKYYFLVTVASLLDILNNPITQLCYHFDLWFCSIWNHQLTHTTNPTITWLSYRYQFSTINYAPCLLSHNLYFQAHWKPAYYLWFIQDQRG